VIIVGASAVLKKPNQQNPNKPLSRFKKKEKLVTPMRQGMDANQQRQTSSGAKPLSPTRLGTCTIPMRVGCWSAATCSFSERPAGRFFGSRPVTNPFLTNTTGDCLLRATLRRYLVGRHPIPMRVSAGRREPRTVASKDLKEVVRLLCASKRNLP